MERNGSQSTYLLVPILLISVLLSTAVIRGPHLVSLSGFGSAIIVAAPLVLWAPASLAHWIARKAVPGSAPARELSR